MNYSAILNPEHIKSKMKHTVLYPLPAYLEIFCNFFKRIELLIVGELATQERSRMQTGGGRCCWPGVKCLRRGSSKRGQRKGGKEGVRVGWAGPWERRHLCRVGAEPRGDSSLVLVLSSSKH